ncbi:MAG: trehalose-6-phosphate synthase, partial [Burkholderiaceae bacterium]
MTRFLLIYHRQPFEEVLDERGQTQRIPPRSPNGIVPSLTGFLQHLPQPDGAGWLAWRLTQKEEPTVRVDEVRVEASRPNDNPLRVLRLGLTQAEVGSFYHVTSKAALWPILHSFPSEFDEQAANWERFQAVNRKFAQAA